MNSNLVLIGFIVIIIGIAIVTLAAASSFKKARNIETAGVILIGPFPIIIGSNRKLLLIAVVAALILAILILALLLI